MDRRVVVVTGASSGIGRSAALLFAQNGWSVFAIGRNEGELSAVGAEASGPTHAFATHSAELTDIGQLDGAIDGAVKRFGRIDALVNSAGIIKSGTIETTTPDEWDEMMNINLRATFNMMQRCVPELAKSNGSIVNVSSVTGLRAFPGVLAYCVSKAATDQLTRCSALELAAQGIRVNAVNPGVIETNLHKRGGMPVEDYDRFLANAANTHPLGRAGQPGEVAELIYFLASEKAAWITGATYEIDGGRAQTCAR